MVKKIKRTYYEVRYMAAYERGNKTDAFIYFHKMKSCI